MGYYINRTKDGTPLPKRGKVDALVADGAKAFQMNSLDDVRAFNLEAGKLSNDELYNKLVMVLHYDHHDAAGWAYSINELGRFSEAALMTRSKCTILLYPYIRETVDGGPSTFDNVVVYRNEEAR